MNENSNKTKVLFRVDANRAIGVGHAMRCLAIAEYLIDCGYKAYFAMHDLPANLEPRLVAAGIEVIPLSEKQKGLAGLKTVVQNLQASHLVLDGYHLPKTFEEAFKATAVPVLRFDDYMPGKEGLADVIVNASPHAEKAVYGAWAPNATLLLGPKYIAFRSDMIAGFKAKQSLISSGKRVPRPKSIMINFGGSDPLDMTVATVLALSKSLPEAPVEAVTGAAYPEPERLKKLGLKNFKHHHNSDNLSEIMQRACMAISAGGLTVTELALFRIPTILAITAENQIKGAHVSWCHTLLPEDITKLGTQDTIQEIVREATMIWNSPNERQKIIERIPEEVDISGAKRIVDTFLEIKK